MLDMVKGMLKGQFEAALCMLDQCIRACPEEHWEGKIANATFRWVAYHTLFWFDLYLSPGDEYRFDLRDLYLRGGDERQDGVENPGLSKSETLNYVAICHQKLLETLAEETAESLQGPSGFDRRPKTRLELHVYNLRHVQHHTGQLSAYLRRVGVASEDDLRWVGTGWR